VDELPQKEVARRLGITEKSVEKHVMKGMKLLAAVFRGTEEEAMQEASQALNDREKENGKP
jgi:RNA polymerase sigma-70 factor (ECF subfamily)